MLESYSERTARKKIKALGGQFKKLVPIEKGDPDRLLLISDWGNDESAKIVFIEMKKVGKKPTKLQLYRHQQLRSMGFRVEVCFSWGEVVEIFKEEACI